MDNLIITPDSSRIILQSLEVRLIFPEERIHWNDLMRKYHYLGFHSLIGESLRYTAVYQNRWLALIGWAAPALKCKVRDQWIGWPDTLKNIRLPLIANNSRFLILPHIHIPNLASKILSLNLTRLSSDWQKIYGHPIWIVETFVDPRYFQGTCYKAANWSLLGHTRGFSKSANTYKQHNNPKLVFVKSLCPKAKEKIMQPALKIKQEVKPMRLSEKQADNLISILLKIPDPRSSQGIRHQRISIIAIAICALICNAQTFAAIAEWASNCSQNMLKRLRCRKDKTRKYIPPSEPTIRRFLQKVDAPSVDRALSEFFLFLLSNSTSPVAVDGKTLKGAKQADGHQVHLLSAFLHKEGAVIAQTEIQSKTNEIPMLRILLEPLDIKGRVVTADALHTQAETAKFIKEKKEADYLFIAKDNQKNLKQDISDLNMPASPPQHQTVDKDHGRIETRKIWASCELKNYIEFPYAEQVICIQREFTHLKTGKQTTETVYGLTSLSQEKANPNQLLQLNREHWAIENSLHYVRDVTLNEDRSQIRTKNAPRVMASLRNFMISMFHFFKVKNIAKKCRLMACKSHLALKLLCL